jgi:hypothetical protein
MSVLCHPLSALSLAIATVLVAAAPAHADEKRDRGRGAERAEAREADRTPRQRRQDTLSDSIRRIERSTRGEVLSAERMQSDGRDVNRIKVVDDSGRVRVYMDDPQQRRGTPTRGDDD